MMYCSVPAGVMDQEQRVLELLPLTAGYAVAGSTLTLLDRTGTPIMTFDRAAEPTNAPLVGTTWRLAGFSDNATARSALASSNATVVFGADGRLSGTTGCNDVAGPYTANETAISIGPLAVTERACADPALMLQERELLDALEAGRHLRDRGRPARPDRRPRQPDGRVRPRSPEPSFYPPSTTLAYGMFPAPISVVTGIPRLAAVPGHVHPRERDDREPERVGGRVEDLEAHRDREDEPGGPHGRDEVGHLRLGRARDLADVRQARPRSRSR